MKRKNAKELLNRYLNGKATPQEVALIERAYAHFADPASGNPVQGEEATMAALDNKVMTQLSKPASSKVGRFVVYVAAAVLLAVIGIGLSFYFYESVPASTAISATEVPPG